MLSKVEKQSNSYFWSTASWYFSFRSSLWFA